MLSKKIIIFGGTSIFLISTLFSLYFFSSNFTSKITPSEFAIPTPEEQNYQINLIGEIASFDAARGIESFKNNVKYLDSVSAFLYGLNSDGSVSFIGNITRQQEAVMLNFAREKNVQILLGIGNDYKSESLDKILFDKNGQKNHIKSLLELVTEAGYDGVAIDFENLQEDQTDAYTQYLRNLVSEFKSNNKFVALAANTETSGYIYDGIDIASAAKLVDRLDFNSFDEFGPWSGPGPIASIGWIEKIIKNLVVQGVPSQKIVVGTATSGKDWWSDSGQFYKDLTAREYLDFALKRKTDLVWDEKSQSNYFNWEDAQGNEHVVWLEDARSTMAKIELAKKYRLHGVFIWFLGGEDLNLWLKL